MDPNYNTVQELTHRLEVFDPGDKSAIVCLDVPEMERLAVEQLHELGYKIHTGLSIDDIILKMRAHTYDVLIISAHWGGSDVATNLVMLEVLEMPASQRRQQFVCLIGPDYNTADELQAFQLSVDAVINLADVVNLRPVLRRGLTRNKDFFGRFIQVIEQYGISA